MASLELGGHTYWRVDNKLVVDGVYFFCRDDDNEVWLTGAKTDGFYEDGQIDEVMAEDPGWHYPSEADLFDAWVILFPER